MTCGVVLPVDAVLMEDILFESAAWLRHADPNQAANDPRFAAAIFRTALNNGIMDHVTFQEPAPAS